MHRFALAIVVVGCAASSPAPAPVVGAAGVAAPPARTPPDTWSVLPALDVKLLVADPVMKLEAHWSDESTVTLHTARYSIVVHEVQRDAIEPTLGIKDATEELRTGLAEIAVKTLQDSADGATFLVELDGTSGPTRYFRSHGRYLASNNVRYDCRGEAEAPQDRAKITAACRTLQPTAVNESERGMTRVR